MLFIQRLWFTNLILQAEYYPKMLTHFFPHMQQMLYALKESKEKSHPTFHNIYRKTFQRILAIQEHSFRKALPSPFSKCSNIRPTWLQLSTPVLLSLQVSWPGQMELWATGFSARCPCPWPMAFERSLLTQTILQFYLYLLQQKWRNSHHKQLLI